MKGSVSVFCRLVITVTICLAAGFFSSVPASNGETIMGGEIPLMDGAEIVKESLFNGSGSFELEVDALPEKVANFYKQAMEEKGWPPGMVMSIGNQSVLMLNRQGDQFVLKAESKNGHTRVIITLIRKAQAQEAATEPLPSADTAAASKEISSVPQSETVPQNNSKIIEGPPPTKGSLVQRIVVPPSQGQGEELGKKDPGSLPEDPSPQPEDPSPDPEDSSSSSSSDDQSTELDHAADDTPEILPVSLRVTIRWDVTGTDECYQYEGSVSYQFNGVMKLDAAGSPAIQRADRVLMPVLTYKPEVMTVSYTYNETYIDNESDCPVQFEYNGAGVSQIDDDNAAGLKIIRFDAMAAPYLKNLSADKQQFLASMQLSTATPDYYEFYVAGPGQKKTIPGRTRPDSDCIYQSDEKALPGLGGLIQMKFPESGAMQGTRTWSADDKGKCPPTLSITVSDITPILEKSFLRPPEGGNKNVSYTVSWMVGETAESPITATADEDKEDDCEKLQQRLNFISLMEAAYQNQALRDIVEELGDFKGAVDLYQELVEQTVLDAINTNSTLEGQQNDIKNANGEAFMEGRQSFWETTDSPSDESSKNPFMDDPVCEDDEPEKVTGSAAMTTTPSPNFDDPPGYGSFRITDYCTGSAVIVELYDGQGNRVYKGGLDSSLTCWQEKYGNRAGYGRWKGAIEHERGHVRQLATGGGTDSVDKKAKRELECYEIEKKEIKKQMRKLDC